MEDRAPARLSASCVGNIYTPIAISAGKPAQAVIEKGVVTAGILNRMNMTVLPQDPHFGRATHALPGQMRLEVRIFDAASNIRDVLKRA